MRLPRATPIVPRAGRARALRPIASAAAVLALVAANAWGTFELPRVRHVGAGNECEYHTIQSAIDAANGGDTIQIEGSLTGIHHHGLKSWPLRAGLPADLINVLLHDSPA